MCAFRNCKVKSDKILLKKDGIIAYKKVTFMGGEFYSLMRHDCWINKRMTLRKGTSMNVIPNGKGPGIYAYKREPNNCEWKHYRQRQPYVKVLLYGRVIEYASHKATGAEAGYMAQRAEILEVL